MRALLGFVMLGAAVAMPVQAQTVRAGTYAVEGTNLDGSAYSGTAKITLTSETTCAIEWKTGNAGKATSNGICMLYEDSFAAGYVMNGNSVGLVVYKVNSDGSLDGAWTITGQDGSGTETLTPR
jgi:fructose-1,6-bisphosphatase